MEFSQLYQKFREKFSFSKCMTCGIKMLMDLSQKAALNRFISKGIPFHLTTFELDINAINKITLDTVEHVF